MNEKLEQIRQLAERYNAQLNAKFPTAFRRGGDLFLGNCYASSNRIYLGLNPGGNGDHYEFKTGLIDRHFWDIRGSGYRYWENCWKFIQQGRGLHEWLKPATNSLCSPWRTEGWRALTALSAYTGDRLIQYSRAILHTLINHHRGESGVTIIVAGAEGKNFIGDTMRFDWDRYQRYQHGSGTFQWAKAVYQDMVVYQVPHFSRAGGYGELGECARWLSADLNLS